MEEKINRIVEVLISSVTPFQLMMGKVIGVGLVGLTQISVWIILMLILSIVGQQFFGFGDPAMLEGMGNIDSQQMAEQLSQNEDKVHLIINELLGLNWFLIIPLVDRLSVRTSMRQIH